MKPIYRDILVLVLVALLGGVIGWYIKPCPTCTGTTVVEVHDSIAPAKDTGVVAINTNPKLKETRKFTGKRNSSYTSNTNEINSSMEFVVDSVNASNTRDRTVKEYLTVCLDTNIFTVDTQAVDNFKARATATVTNNQLIGLLIEYQNFKPEKWKVMSKTVTVEKKQSLVKVYTGLYGGVSILNKQVASYHGGIGLDAIVKDRHLIGINGGYNSLFQPEIGIRFMEKIILKK